MICVVLLLPQNKTYEELCDVLKKTFFTAYISLQGTQTVLSISSKLNETISQWYARVKKGSVDSRFRQVLERRIKDQFVTGIKDGKILDRIFEESHETTLEVIK